MINLTRRVALATLVCLASGVLASAAAARPATAGTPGKKSVFRPRVHNALGLIPPVGYDGSFDRQLGSGINTPVVYHGGRTMTGGVTVHTIFWAPSGYSFSPAPPGSKSYVQIIEQYFSDVSHDSTGTSGATCTNASCNAFTVEPQYGWGTTPGHITPGDNAITYTTGADAIMDTQPYPAHGCSSPAGTQGCVTDGQIQAEIDRLIRTTGGQRGLHNLWFVFLPPNVDECDGFDVCGTNAFAGYHGVSDVHQHGVTIYAIAIDPIIEVGGFPPGQDPEGNPDAEVALDTAAHETNEAMTDPEGVGWMDPDGFEMADKCDEAPNRGTPLGYAPNGSPYNQVVNGHKYLLQEMWSNADDACVQASTSTATGLPIPQVAMTQFSSVVSGNTENNKAGIHVTVKLLRASETGAPVTVATGSGTTAANGRWRVKLSGGHAVGDDRDQIDVDYSGAGAPKHEAILTGNGGDPFALAGWTGWTALDEGAALTNHDPSQGGGPSLSLGACFQAGNLTYAGASGPEPANALCGGVNNVAVVPLHALVGPAARVTVTSTDDRAFGPPNLKGGGNLSGALVRMTMAVGEPGAASNLPSSLPGFSPSGFPTCVAHLGHQTVGCSGLVPGGTYTLTDHGKVVHVTADGGGAVSAALRVRGGDAVALSNGARTLTTLHVARLKLQILGQDPGFVAAGTCSPDEYFGGPLTTAPLSELAGEPTALFGGSALTGQTCPSNGDAFGLRGQNIPQTDERSGGVTETSVGELAEVSPLEGETMYGKFSAVAEALAGRPRISLLILRVGQNKPAFEAGNVDSGKGVVVTGLAAGRYEAGWVIHNLNGDTRTLVTRFIEEKSTLKHHASKRKKKACRGAGGGNSDARCHVSFAENGNDHGNMAVWRTIMRLSTER